MKISKKTLLVIAAGAYIIILAGLGLVAFQQFGEQSEIDEELALARSNLQRLHPETLAARQEELEGELYQVTSQFEVVKALLSEPVGNVAASSIVFDIAKTQGVQVTELSSPSASSDSLEGVTCSAVSLNAKVEGEVSKLVSFITRLNNYLTTGVVKSITMTIPETTSNETASASIQLVVYTYQGD